MQELNLQSFIQFLVPLVITVISVIFTMKHGLKDITDKVEKINLKLEKMDEKQGTTDQHVTLLNYRAAKLEDSLKELAESVDDLERDLRKK